MKSKYITKEELGLKVVGWIGSAIFVGLLFMLGKHTGSYEAGIVTGILSAIFVYIINFYIPECMGR